MGISRATYYHRSVREKEQLQKDLELKEMIEKVHLLFPGYGYRRLRRHFLKQGQRVNTKRIKRVMKIYSIFATHTPTMKPRGTHTALKLRYPNLIRGLKVTGPDQVWATDITYIKLLREYVYLSAILDVYTRRIVGWAVSKNLGHEFCLKALQLAIRKRKPKAGIIHHSDRGIQYVCQPYVECLLKSGFKISMNSVGTPEENAYIESFFKTLKREEVYARNYQTMRNVIANLPKFIDEIYNLKRMHSSLDYQSPDEFEKQVMKLKPAERPALKIWGRLV